MSTQTSCAQRKLKNKNISWKRIRIFFFYFFFLNRPTNKKLTASKNTMQKEWARKDHGRRERKKKITGTKYFIEKSPTTWTQFSLFNCHLFLKRIYQLRNRNNKMFGKRNVMRDHRKRILWSWMPIPEWKNCANCKICKRQKTKCEMFQSERKRDKKKLKLFN